MRVKRFTDGTVNYMFFERPKERGYTLEKEEVDEAKKGSSVARKKVENKKRALQVVYDLARNNPWDWFITLTFDPEKVNSMVYTECVEHMILFTQALRDRGIQYLIVPEQHQSGAYHFHGLVRGNLPVTPAKSPYDGHLLVDGSGRQIYNISIYSLGYTTATAIDDQAKAAGYLSKYLTKELTVPKGKKCYWASRSLARPEEEYLELTAAEFGEVFNEADYQKVIDGPYGRFVLSERRGNRYATQQNKNIL